MTWYKMNPDGKIEPCSLDETEWSKRWQIKTNVEGHLVSTIFLAADVSIRGDYPALFETLIFGGPLSGEVERYATKSQAEIGHEKWVDRLREAIKQQKEE